LKNVILLLVSLFFYFWGEAELVFLMIFSCLMNYAVGLWIDRSPSKKWPLGIGIFLNLSLLSYFKYADFFITNVNRFLPDAHDLDFLHIALPIGISFFTFQSMSYLVDLYRGDVQVQKDPIKLSLYISLFPQLVAGPIVRYHDIAKDIIERNHSLELFNSGVRRFIIGLAKKVLIANVMALLADEIMNRPPDELTQGIAWIGITAYTLQIYYDFSGYSDMAIGLGRMFGFRFLENFNFPYIAKSIQDFWRRWHISLSTWFRDYLYIPLGGNRGSSSRVYFNLVVVFLLTGLWHGASWSFVVWGLFHGMFLIIERLGVKNILSKIGPLSHVYTLLVVMIAWVFFRIEDIGTAFDYLGVMAMGSASVDIPFRPNNEQLFILSVGIFFALNGVSLFKLVDQKLLQLSRFPKFLEIAASTGLLLLFFFCIMALSSNAYNPFIYYRF